MPHVYKGDKGLARGRGVYTSRDLETKVIPIKRIPPSSYTIVVKCLPKL